MTEEQFIKALYAQRQQAANEVLANRRERIDKEVQANTLANRGMDGPPTRGVLEPEARIWGGVGSLQTNDPLAIILERLGKLRGASEFNKGSLAKGTSGRLNADMRAQMSALEQALQGYQDDNSLQQEMMREQIRQMKLSGKAERRALARKSAIEKRQLEQSGNRQYSVSDPYRNLRESAISAARKYLNIDSPHLISSLDLNRLD